ncbi:secretory pathway protein Sec39-domain-containing protein [Chlamydoabsidia padenii]|nr:secretory pathway protein Sec39-domain-containing protein [Chlamydoabsidia padenii]
MTESSTHKDFLYHLTQRHYQAALDLGRELDINTDVVYKAQWTYRVDELGSQLTKQDIDLLERIHDDAWVVSQCLQVLVNSHTLQERLLQLGLSKTHQHTDALLQTWQHNDDKTSTHQVQENDTLWIRARRYFLQYLDRLQTFNKIWPTMDASLFADAYGDFRDVNLVAQAIEFARSENNHGLDALFMHHGQTILPHRLFILSQVPETVDPAGFDLPHVTGAEEDAWVQEPWRQDPDPVELPWVDELLYNNNKEDDLLAPEDASYSTHLNQVVQTTPYPASADVIAQWYMNRARTMDSLGLASHALGLLRYAKAMGVPDMDNYVERYDWLCKFIYASSTQDNSVVMDLDAFEQLSAYDVLEGLLLHTKTETVIQDMRRLAVPWLDRCAKKQQTQQTNDNETEIDDDDDDERPAFLLYRWLLGISFDHLARYCAVFEASKPTLPMEDRIIKDDCDLTRLVLATVYSSDGSMEYLVRMFECLPISLYDDNEESISISNENVDMAALLPLAATPLGLFTALQSIDRAGLTKMMDTLQSHLMSAEVLVRYHASVPLRWYLQQDQPVNVQRQLCIRMASQAAGGVETGGAQFDRDDDWRELLDDMLRLHDDGKGIFGKLDTTEIMEIFYSSLLRCGKFNLAKELVVGPRSLMGLEQAEKLVIDAEREFFDNSSTGNMNTDNMKKAWDCLQVLPTTDNIKKEMDLIEATHILISVYQIADKPGITLMPIQLRQSTNRLDLISKLVNTRKGIYRQFKEIVTLTNKLGYQGDLLAEVTVLSMMAGAAMVDEEYIICYRLCQATVDKAQSITTQHNRAYVDKLHQAAWQICFNLGKLEAWDDTLRRRDLLAMALTVCPVEYMHDILAVYQSLDQHPLDPLDMLTLESMRYDDSMELDRGHAGWQGLLESAKKRQWIIGDLLKAGGSSIVYSHHDDTTETTLSSKDELPLEYDSNHSGKRKRDQLRNIVGGVGGWLFQQ